MPTRSLFHKKLFIWCTLALFRLFLLR